MTISRVRTIQELTIDELESDIRKCKERIEMCELMKAYTPRQMISDYQMMVDLLKEVASRHRIGLD